jgi:hypothetical protein
MSSEENPRKEKSIMARASKEEFFKPQQKLMPDDVDGDSVILTIAEAKRVTTKEGRNALVVSFEETDKVWWPNATSIGHLLEALGDEYDEATGLFDWTGKKVPLIVHVQKDGLYAGSRNLWAAEPATWSAFGCPTAKPVRAALPASKSAKPAPARSRKR